MKILLFLAKGFETMEFSVFVDVMGWARNDYQYDLPVVTCGFKKQVMSIVTDSRELDEPKEWENCNIYALSKLFMNEDELANLRQRYATPGEGYGHFKMTLLDKINAHFEPYAQKREHYLNNPKEVKEILAFGASKAKKINKIQDGLKELDSILHSKNPSAMLRELDYDMPYNNTDYLEETIIHELRTQPEILKEILFK